MASALRVEVAAAFSSKSQTGSMIAHLRLTGSETTYCQLPVFLSWSAVRPASDQAAFGASGRSRVEKYQSV